MKKNLLNSWIPSLNISMDKDCIENYLSRWLFRFPEDRTCVNLPAMSGMHQYYNLLLPRINYFLIGLELHFSNNKS